MTAKSIIAALAATAVPALALAAGPLQLTSRLLVETRVAAKDGTTRVELAPAGRVTPGDRVTVALAYRNAGAQPLVGVVLANPVPANLAYRAAAPGSPLPELSVDGRNFGPLAGLRVTTPTGATRPAGPDDVTHVRWRLARPIAAGGQGQLAFQAVLK